MGASAHSLKNKKPLQSLLNYPKKAAPICRVDALVSKNTAVTSTRLRLPLRRYPTFGFAAPSDLSPAGADFDPATDLIYEHKVKLSCCGSEFSEADRTENVFRFGVTTATLPEHYEAN